MTIPAAGHAVGHLAEPTRRASGSVGMADLSWTQKARSDGWEHRPRRRRLAKRRGREV